MRALRELAGHPAMIEIEDVFEHADHTVYIIMERIRVGERVGE